MNKMEIKRLDHLGIVAGTIKELGVIEKIDKRLRIKEREEISTGEAIAGMIINGLGFNSRPLSLTPEFFEPVAVEKLLREGIEAKHLNRHKLGRSLDAVHKYGCERLLREIAGEVVEEQGINLRFKHLDTTSFCVTGDYHEETDEQTIEVKPGYSKDHRPDLKQIIQELIVSQDGGIPLMSRCWNGNSSDNEVFKTRARALIQELKGVPWTGYLIADSKLYSEGNAKNLKNLKFITRIPSTIKLVEKCITTALTNGTWQEIDTNYKYQRFELKHYNIEQQWIVVYSKAAHQRAIKSVEKAVNREKEKINSQLYHLQAKRFETKPEAQQALEQITAKWKYHQLEGDSYREHSRYTGRGRPKAGAPATIVWQVAATAIQCKPTITDKQQQQSSLVLGTNTTKQELTAPQVLQAYKGQNCVERGFAFLKSALFFVSSFFVKKTSRLEAIVWVMTLALLVYSIAQRTLRNNLTQRQQTLPNQIGQPTLTPTLRWVFQLLEGIYYVQMEIDGRLRIFIQGISELKNQIISLFGQRIHEIYHLPV
jgi:transposase